jgi:DNA-binding CsgD family transcriptional regulator
MIPDLEPLTAWATSDSPDGHLDVIDRMTREITDGRDATGTSERAATELRDSARADEIERLGSTPAGRRVLALMAYRTTRMGESSERAVALARQALADDLLLCEAPGSFPIFAAGHALGVAGRTQEAEHLFESLARQAQATGARVVWSAAIGQRGVERFRRGALLLAQADLELAVDIAHRQVWEGLIDDRRAHLLRVHQELGNLDAANHLLERWNASGPLPSTIVGTQLMVERGRLYLEAGRAAESIADFRRVEDRARETADPLELEWRRPAALAHYHVGDHNTAERLAHEELRLAQRWGAARQLGLAMSTVGLIHAGSLGLQFLREANDVLAGSPAELDYARVLIDLGAALRRAGQARDARIHLQRGLEIALSCRSRSLADRGRHELAATGVTRRRTVTDWGPETLTPTERRVAEMAAGGLSNPEIAGALFVSRKTVEMHLGNAYRKLGISSRSQLASALPRAA